MRFGLAHFGCGVHVGHAAESEKLSLVSSDLHEPMIGMPSARFSVGDVVQHNLFGYRGVIVDVDTHFLGTEAWYEAVARSRPPKHRPWYHVLPHEAQHQTYVAERNLERDESGLPIQHPLLERYFTDFGKGRYVSDVQMH